MDGNRYDPAVHAEFVELRKKTGLDEGNTPPIQFAILRAVVQQHYGMVEDAAQQSGEGGGEAGG